MLRKDHVYQTVQNCYHLVKYSLKNSRSYTHVISDVTLHVNMTVLAGQVLIKTSQTEKGWIVEKDGC